MLITAPVRLGIGLWCAYTAIQKRRLERGTHASMRLVSETTRKDGEWNNNNSIGKPATQVPDDWILLEGDEHDRQSGTVQLTSHVARAGRSLFGPRAAPNWTLQQLAQERKNPQKLVIEEDIAKRVAWDRAMKACEPSSTLESGEYRFLYRNYVNHEELFGMLCRRMTMAGLLFRLGDAGRLQVDEHQYCSLVEQCKVLGFVPMAIEWKGHIVGSEIEWTTSNCQLGWKRFGKFYDKPAAAEKLRKDNWEIARDADGMCVFYRKGVGSLVYANSGLFS